MTARSGVVVVDKPSALTSHDVVARLRKVLQTKRIGHAGSLDPMATGVLILGVNRATRLLGYLTMHEKQYTATVRLGQSSATDDADGELTSVADASGLGWEQVDAACDAFRGCFAQVPSAISAVKVDGRRAYERARSGQEVKLKARQITVSRLTVVAAAPVGQWFDVEIEVECSAGTYIRAIARDLGKALGVGGHLTALRRTRIGNYTLADAVQLGDEPPELMPMADVARLSFPVVELDESQAGDVVHGRRLPIAVPASPTGVLAPDGTLMALYEPAGEESRPVAVLVDPSQSTLG